MLMRPVYAPLLIAALAWAGISTQSAAQEGRPPTAVTVVTLQPQQATLTTTLPGRVAASAMAEVRPQVAGIITERLFTEGAPVTEGDALYRIDPASYDAALAQADAAVAQAMSQLDPERIRRLRKPGPGRSLNGAEVIEETIE